MERMLSIWFGAGLLRPAPGTWASAIAIMLAVGLHWIGGFPLLAAGTLIVTAVGFWAVDRYTDGMEDPDRPEIVIDEVAGQWLAFCFPSAGFMMAGLPNEVIPYPGWVAAFLLFRLFDIWKPWVIGQADRRGDAAGVMLDDLWAGLFAGLGTIALAALAHGFLM